MIYFDNAATTKPLREVLDAMRYAYEEYGNPGSRHIAGASARSAMDHARSAIASRLHAADDQILFTAGASESNTMVFRGLAKHLLKAGKTNLIVSRIEHDSVIRAARSLVKDFGFSVTWLLPDETGRISEEQVSAAILPETGLCSVMYVNNELGTVNPVSKIGALCHEHGVLFHTDVTQALSAYPIDVGYLNCDFLSASAHKIHGPMGVGLLYAKDTSLLTPQIYGGEDQELGLRGGTENVPGIAGFASAVCALDLWRVSWQQDIRAVRERFLQALEYSLKSKGIPDSMVYTVDPAHTVPNILSLRFPGIDSETMMAMLSQVGVCVSSGSACRAHSSDPSLVLLAIGLSADEARSTLRVSFSHFNTQDEAAVAAFRFADVASMLLQ